MTTSSDTQTTVQHLLAACRAEDPAPTAAALRDLWLAFELKEIHALSERDREKQETAGASIPDLKKVGKALAAESKRDVPRYLPLVELLWTDFGREGRVVALMAFGAMELQEPGLIVPKLRDLCRGCHTWEDADRLAMDALEPIVRKEPDAWLPEMEAWIGDPNKWVRRAGAVVVGRLTMKRPAYTARCLALLEPLLGDPDTEVKKGLSFAIRVCARGDLEVLGAFLARQVPPTDPEATWVLCDCIRSMTKSLLPRLAHLRPAYARWLEQESLSPQARRSIASALSMF